MSSKRFTGKLFSALGLLLVLISASALSIEAPDYLNVGDKAAEFSFIVQNSTSLKKNLLIDFYVPTKFEILNGKEYLLPGEAQEITVKVYPNLDIAGTRYTSTLSVRLGSEKVEKEIKVRFIEPAAVQPEPAPSPSAGFAGLAGLAEGFASSISWEIALDVVLFFLAAILLVAFISRLVKIFSRQNKGESKRE